MSTKEVQEYVNTNLPTDNPVGFSIQKADIEDKDRDEAKKAFELSKDMAKATLPVVTGLGLSMIFDSSSGLASDIFKILGFPIAVGGIFIDTIKAPVTASISVGSLIWGLFYKTKSMIKRPDKDKAQTEEIVKSFIQRFGNTMQLLVALNLETPQSIADKFNKYQNKTDIIGIESLCALTILNTAFASRRLEGASILLANGKVLHRKNCPKKGLSIFDSVIEIKDLLREYQFHCKTNYEATPILVNWVPLIKDTLETGKSSNNIGVILTDEISQLLTKLILLLKKVGEISVKQKEFGDRSDGISTISIKKSTLVPQRVIKSNEFAKSEIYLDHFTQHPIINAVITNNGYICNHSTAEKLIATYQINSYIKIYSAGGPENLYCNHEDFTIDPITCDPIEQLVVANDGRFYDHKTALMLKQEKLVGVGGQIVNNFIEVKLKN
jgi:hypothetical protein